MNVTNDGFKDRQLHIEDCLQMVSVERKRVCRSVRPSEDC